MELTLTDGNIPARNEAIFFLNFQIIIIQFGGQAFSTAKLNVEQWIW
jgi:hypothetical protein